MSNSAGARRNRVIKAFILFLNASVAIVFGYLEQGAGHRLWVWSRESPEI